MPEQEPFKRWYGYRVRRFPLVPPTPPPPMTEEERMKARHHVEYIEANKKIEEAKKVSCLTDEEMYLLELLFEHGLKNDELREIFAKRYKFGHDGRDTLRELMSITLDKIDELRCG